VISPGLHEGALTEHFLDAYCRGRGAEIGPGRRRLGARERTVSFDRFRRFARIPATDVDVLADAAVLPLQNEVLDYVISSHCLEHVPDPLICLEEWLRVLKPTANLLLILPHLDRTFDRGRPVSTLEHHLAERGLVNDLDSPLHFDEWERRVLRDRPGWLSNPGAKRPDGSLNPRYAAERGRIHYHCWTQDEVIRILQHLRCKIVAAIELLPERPDSFLVVARKP
jgi:SAM-dependent methyltransferase